MTLVIAVIFNRISFNITIRTTSHIMAPKVPLKEKNYHVPDEKLVKYIAEKSYLEARKDGLIARGEKTSKREKQELEQIKSRLDTLKNTKTDVLNDIIFPSMANLIFFFEAIKAYEKLGEVFESDILDLLGVKRLNPRSFGYGIMFYKLLAAILDIDSKVFDFRLRLAHILQELIIAKINNMYFETIDSSKLIRQDMYRARTWTQLLATRVRDVYNLEILSSGKYGQEAEDREMKFNEDALESGKKPKRTFTFVTKQLIESEIRNKKGKNSRKN